MKKVGFVGAYDKIDLLLNVAKFLTSANKRVIIVDSTLFQRARYIIPVIHEEKQYVTTFEDIDIAVGFQSVEELKKYSKEKAQTFEYDVMLVDADDSKIFDGFALQSAEENFFVTSFELYALRKGIEILKNLEQPIEMIKVFFTEDILKVEEEYSSYLTANVQVKWDTDKVFFVKNKQDSLALIENQHAFKIKILNLSKEYQESILMIAYKILGNIPTAEMKKMLKKIEKGE